MSRCSVCEEILSSPLDEYETDVPGIGPRALVCREHFFNPPSREAQLDPLEKAIVEDAQAGLRHLDTEIAELEEQKEKAQKVVDQIEAQIIDREFQAEFLQDQIGEIVGKRPVCRTHEEELERLKKWKLNVQLPHIDV